MTDEIHTTHDERGSYAIVKTRDIKTVVRECQKLAGHRHMQVAGPARRCLNLLRPYIEGGAK